MLVPRWQTADGCVTPIAARPHLRPSRHGRQASGGSQLNHHERIRLAFTVSPAREPERTGLETWREGKYLPSRPSKAGCCRPTPPRRLSSHIAQTRSYTISTPEGPAKGKVKRETSRCQFLPSFNDARGRPGTASLALPGLRQVYAVVEQVAVIPVALAKLYQFFGCRRPAQSSVQGCLFHEIIGTLRYPHDLL